MNHIEAEMRQVLTQCKMLLATLEPTLKTQHLLSRVTEVLGRQPYESTDAALPEMPPVNPRRPYIDERLDGYLESDDDMVGNNVEAVRWFLDNHEGIRKALAQRLPPRSPLFVASNEYVRGPSRPQGSGYKEIVIPMRSARQAQMTAENLNALFEAHCVR